MPTFPEVPATLGGLKAEGFPMQITCGRCTNRAKPDLDALIAKYGADKPWREIKFRCGRCETRGPQINVDVLIPWDKMTYP